jgi:Flp pilus assembly protein TadG
MTQNCAKSRRAGRRQGNALVEFALIAPLLLPIVLVIFDIGMYTYAFVSLQNAARAAAVRNSGGPDSAADQSAACALVIEELRGLPNIGSSFDTPCAASPLVVTSVLCDDTTACIGTATSADGQRAVSVTVTYTPPALFRLPFVGPNSITRNAQMKVRNSD